MQVQVTLAGERVQIEREVFVTLLDNSVASHRAPYVPGVQRHRASTIETVFAPAPAPSTRELSRTYAVSPTPSPAVPYAAVPCRRGQPADTGSAPKVLLFKATQ